MPDATWPVLVHVNPTSLIEEGADEVFDVIQSKAEPTGVLLAAHGFNPEVIDRGRTWPGHGEKGIGATLGGYFGVDHAEYYHDVPLGSPRVREDLYQGFDAMEVASKATTARGLELHVYILESAGTGGFQRNVTGWPALLEIDVDGKRSKLPCVNHPVYRRWKLALLEDLHSSYSFAGLLWGVERWGPLHQVIAGESPGCFCEHCRSLAIGAGLDWGRTVKGYSTLRKAAAASSRADVAGLLGTMLAYPEILGWEAAWTNAYLSLHRELYGASKWLQPERSFGLGLWHYYFINPLLNAEWNLKDFAAASDYIRPILYHLPEGPRIKRYLSLMSSFLGNIDEETIWSLFSQALGWRLPSIQSFAKAGLPADYVKQGVEMTRRNAGEGARVIAGLGVDVFEYGLDRSMTPADVEAAILAAREAKADGITISRNYAEMQHANLEAVGRTLRAMRG